MQRFAFGRFEVRPDERRLLVAGAPVALGARAFDLLVALIERRDRVVGKDELFAAAWPATVVEESNLTVQVAALRKVLGANVIATVAGRGCRFTGELGAVPEATAHPSAASGPALAPLALPDKPSIVVLPFRSIGDDLGHDYFADGITEDITTELSRFRSLFVIASASAFTYKGHARDVRQVGRELGVRYIVEGSVRRAGNRVRVTAQLIDAESGSHLWTERYDRVVEDVFVVQEEITRSIVAAIAPEIEASELVKIGRVRPTSFSAYELGLRAAAYAFDAWAIADEPLRLRAIEYARKALAIDSACAVAWNVLASSHYQAVFFGRTTNVKATALDCVNAVNAAIAIDRADHRPYAWRGVLRVHSADPRRKREGLDDICYAHALNPNDAMTLCFLGLARAFFGDTVAGRDHLLAALRMSPRDPFRWGIHSTLGLACFLAKDYAQGAAWSLRSSSDLANYPPARLHAALNYVGLGQLVQARHELDVLHRIAPQILDGAVSRGLALYADPEQRRRAEVFVRVAAGIEDPGAADALR